MVHVLEENLMKLSGAGDMGMVFKSAVDEVYDLLKNDLDEDVMERWKNFAEQINHLFNEMSKNIKGLRVIIHGNSWNNNFMFKYEVRSKDARGSLTLKFIVSGWRPKQSFKSQHF
jgi:hypothetical protein